MGNRKQPGESRTTSEDQALRDQEVVRANRELAAYFKGRRTEREARAALKIIKRFVRERERMDPKKRPPLPAVTRAAAASSPQRPVPEKRQHADSDSTPAAIAADSAVETDFTSTSRH